MNGDKNAALDQRYVLVEDKRLCKQYLSYKVLLITFY